MKLASIASLAILVACVTCTPARPTSETELSTLAVAVPSFADAFTKTFEACPDAPAFVVVGNPTGVFQPGSTTVFLPPQASVLSTTYIEKALNLTEYLIATPLPGSCAALSLPAAATDTITSGPYAVPGPSGWNNTVCPLKGCSRGVDRAAQMIIGALDEVTIASQRLQAAAMRLGSTWDLLDEENMANLPDERFSVIHDFIIPLKDIPATLLFILPLIQALSPLPQGCDTDTIVVALIDFVKVLTALLEILIGRASLLYYSRGGGLEIVDTYSDVEHSGFSILIFMIAGALRAIEAVVDTLAYDLISLLPTRQRCLKLEWMALHDTLRLAVAAYQ